MAELQTTIEISVELNRFFNVDLFQRGHYQVQLALRTPVKPLARVEVCDNWTSGHKTPAENSANFRQDCVGKSRKFQILYRNEEVNLSDVFIFRINALVESTRLEKNLEALDLRLDVQLWCSEDTEISNSDEKLELVSTRTLLLHLSATKGLHHSLPVLFDYFHLSAVEVVIHGSVVAIHQPYLSIPKSQKPSRVSDVSTLEAVYFGQKNGAAAAVSPPSPATSSSVRIQQAHLMHKTICNILLSAHESLQDYLQKYSTLTSGSNSSSVLVAKKDCLTKLGETVLKVQGVLEEDDLIQTAQADITQLCAENVLLWKHFLGVALQQGQIHLRLATEHHSQRVRRFAEGFFTMEHNKSSCLSCYDPDFHGHSSLAIAVRNSPYFCNLPSLSVECVELDGDDNTLPVIFEDIFRDSRAQLPQVYQTTAVVTTDSDMVYTTRERSSSNSSSSLTSDRDTPPRLRRRSSMKKFLKSIKSDGHKRPSSYNCRDKESAAAKLPKNPAPDTASVTLVGYRKISVPDNEHAVSGAPGHRDKAGSLATSSSFPSMSFKGSKKESGQNTSLPHATSTVDRSVALQAEESTAETSGLGASEADSNCQVSPSFTHKKSEVSPSLTNKTHEVSPSLTNKTREVSPSLTNKKPEVSPSHTNKSFNVSPSLKDKNTPYLPSIMDQPGQVSLSLSEKNSQTSPSLKVETKDSSPTNRSCQESQVDLATLTNSPCIFLHTTLPGNFPRPSLPCQTHSIISLSDVTVSVSTESSNRSQLSPSRPQESPQLTQTQTSQDYVVGDKVQPDVGVSQVPSSTHQAVLSMNDDDFSDDETNIPNGFDDDLGIFDGRDATQNSFPVGITTKLADAQVLALPNTEALLGDEARTKDIQAAVYVGGGSIDSLQGTDARNVNCAFTGEIFLHGDRNYPNSSAPEMTSQNMATVLGTSVTETLVTQTPSTGLSSGTVIQSCTRTVTDSSMRKEDLGNNLNGVLQPNTTEMTSNPMVESGVSPEARVTVMELLKEEYNKSLVGQLANQIEASPLSCQRAASDSDILRNCEEKKKDTQTSQQGNGAVTNEGSDKKRSVLTSSSSYPELSHAQPGKSEPPRLVSVVGQHTVNFVQLRESLKLQMDFAGHIYSECPLLASSIPYFHVPADVDEFGSGLHLIICVHGLDGNSADLRLVRTFIEMSLPGFKLQFLMSERNQQDTFADFDKMTDRLVEEILTYFDCLGSFGQRVTRISFVGHSLGNVIIRSTLTRPELSHILPKLYTFLSLSGPHLGTLYNTSGLVNMGMWFMQKWKKSGSLLQLSLKDHSDPRQTFLYRLSQKPVLQYFKHVLLIGSHQDRYVPYHSSRIEICRSAQKDSSVTGAVYREMAQNILEPIIQSPQCTLIRYDVFHALPSTANTMIGRAAHIAVLDSEIFIEKFLSVTGLKFFQ